MSTILIIVLVILLLGGFGGYHGYNRYGGTGLGGVLGLVLVVLVVLWLVGSGAGASRPEADADVPRDHEDDAKVGQHRLDWQAVPLRPEHHKHGLGCAAGRTAAS